MAHIARKRPAQLFGRKGDLTTPAVAWNASLFKAVDDRVRGGSSTSQVAVIEDGKDGEGELKFSGFLDTLTLGGAGFASQQYNSSSGAFPITLNATQYEGLSVRVRKPVTAANTTAPQPGGGQGPVTQYNLNLYTTEPQQRPDGRNYSSVVYEADFNVTAPSAEYADDVVSANEKRTSPTLLSFDLPFSSFKPTYRGRPADDAEPLDPAKITLWSLMARSNFSQQSGPFELQLNSMWALPTTNDVAAPHVHARSTSWLDTTPANLTGSPGFALYLFGTLAFVLWILWAITPDAWLNKMGVTWYPDREWAFILPAFSVLVVLLAYVVYIAINLRMTPELDHLSTVVDEHTNPFPLKRADEMTFDEAVRYYHNEHPSVVREQDRHVRDLAI